MSDKPLVSVIIPLYNKRSYIRRAIGSVKKQTFNDWEIIIVDDGSTDGSTDEISVNDTRICLSRQTNKGPGAARNAGLAMARGKYVSFLDADDEWLPSFLKAGLSFLEDKTENVAIACTGFYYCPGMKRNVVADGEELKGIYEVTAATDIKLVQHILSLMWTCALIMRIDAVRKWGGFFDENKCLYGENVYLILKMLFNEKIAIVPEPLAIYHTDASDLYGGSTKRILFPTTPYLKDPTDILSSCPAAKLHILKELLAMKTLNRAKNLSKYGKGQEAKELLNRFNQYGYPLLKGVPKVRLYASCAPILPVIRRIRHYIRSLIGICIN